MVSQYKLAAFSTSRNKYHEVVTPEVVFLCKKTMAREGVGDRKILIYLLIYSNKLAYLQLITVFVYGNSSPKSHKQDYLNFQQKLWKIIEFIFRRYNFTKNEVFLRYFSGFCLKVPEDFFYHGTCMLLQNTPLYICVNTKYVVHCFLKRIQSFLKLACQPSTYKIPWEYSFQKSSHF